MIGNVQLLRRNAKPGPSLVLSENRTLRFVTLFLFYVAQGLPFGLIDFAIPAWLAQKGASAAQIGSILALAILPWTFKLAYGLSWTATHSSPWGGGGPGSSSASWGSSPA